MGSMIVSFLTKRRGQGGGRPSNARDLRPSTWYYRGDRGDVPCKASFISVPPAFDRESRQQNLEIFRVAAFRFLHPSCITLIVFPVGVDRTNMFVFSPGEPCGTRAYLATARSVKQPIERFLEDNGWGTVSRGKAAIVSMGGAHRLFSLSSPKQLRGVATSPTAGTRRSRTWDSQGHMVGYASA